ncbi:MAG: hypothetical protein M3N23_06835 [Pseudomonadota bacterium]|nr:hypothetical protein [Pseudomonadota bacterium]
MDSDQQLLYHKGQEFTKIHAPHIHCIVLSLSPTDRSYIVDYTCSGNMKKVSEVTLTQRYMRSTLAQKKDAMKTLCESVGEAGYLDEDGTTALP